MNIHQTVQAPMRITDDGVTIGDIELCVAEAPITVGESDTGLSTVTLTLLTDNLHVDVPASRTTTTIHEKKEIR